MSFTKSRAYSYDARPIPHAIAATRALTYTRFTLQALVRCLLDYADAEFTRDTGEALAELKKSPPKSPKRPADSVRGKTLRGTVIKR